MGPNHPNSLQSNISSRNMHRTVPELVSKFVLSASNHTSTTQGPFMLLFWQAKAQKEAHLLRAPLIPSVIHSRRAYKIFIRGNRPSFIPTHALFDCMREKRRLRTCASQPSLSVSDATYPRTTGRRVSVKGPMICGAIQFFSFNNFSSSLIMN